MKPARAWFVGLTLALTASGAQASCESGQDNLAGRRVEIDLRHTSTPFAFRDLALRDREIALTFDDGPVNARTPQVLAALDSVCVKAVFFMIGQRAEAAPDLVRKVRSAGHGVASHSYTHRDLSKLPADEAVDDLHKGYAAVETAALGKAEDEHQPRLLRLPEVRSTPQIDDYARKNGIALIGNDISPQDWRNDPPEETLARLLGMLERRKKGVVTLHDNQPNTARMLPLLFAALRERGFTIVQLVPKA